MFPVRDILLFAASAGVLAAMALAVWPWGRLRGRFVVVGVTTAAGFTAWNLTLNATNARGFNVDAPLIRLSWQDAGSGVLAFIVTALVLGLVTEREQAALAGLVTMVFDIFVL